MELKTFSYELLDKKLYDFSERAREDVDYSYLQPLIRKQKIKEAYELIPKDDQALRDAIIMDQFNKIYNLMDIASYLSSNPEEIKKLVYQSFKIKNNIPFEDFQNLIDESMARKLLNMINELEKSEEGLPDDEVCKALGINKNHLVNINKKQPHVYQWLKTNVKKKRGAE